MTTYDQLSTFLRNFKDKLKVFDIYYARREKNIQALLNLEINESQRLDYILKILLPKITMQDLKTKIISRTQWNIGSLVLKLKVLKFI